MLPTLRDVTDKVIRRDLWTDHNATAFSLLGKKAPPVRSQGHGFYHVNWWTLKILVHTAARWAKANPGCQPTRSVVSQWVTSVNGSPRPAPYISIAQTPMLLTLKVALGLKGGLIHELLHGVYSCKRYLTTTEVADLILPRWAKVPDWSRYADLLLGWENLVEDIRIERNGCQEFPGAKSRLMDVNDFVLEREFPILTGNPISIVEATFRGLGKGYTSKWQQDSYGLYQQLNPEAFELVNSGDLNILMLESQLLGKEDDLGALRLAMDIISLIADQVEEDAEQEHRVQCPKCGAPGNKLKVRPLSDGHGGRVPGKGVLTCTVCGFQEEVDLEESAQPSRGLPPPEEDQVQFEDTPQELDDPGDGEDDPGEDDPGEEDEEDGEEDEAGEEDGEGEDGSPGEKDDEPEDWGEMAEDMVEKPEVELIDHQEALADALQKELEVEQDDMEEGEKVWNPLTTENDLTVEIQPSTLGVAYDTAKARETLQGVQTVSAYLRSQFRMRFLDYQRQGVRHGMPSGRDLSERYMVRTWSDLASGRKANRAWTRRGKRLEVTLAAAAVLDQSYSMRDQSDPTDLNSKRLWEVAAEGIMAVMEPLDSLGCSTMITGIRTNSRVYMADFDLQSDVHRTHGVTHDIFKRWDDKFHNTLWRLSNNSAQHSTPLCDGMQVALEELAARDETHRILFVFTDGQPDPTNPPVMRWQFRMAREMGIHVVGVGIGRDAAYVQTTFPDHVFSEDLAGLPVSMVEKLDQLLAVPRRSN